VKPTQVIIEICFPQHVENLLPNSKRQFHHACRRLRISRTTAATLRTLCKTALAMQCNVPASSDWAAAVREVNERTAPLDGKRREHFGRFSKCGGLEG
jgi:succinylarginine dihydrolase